MFGFIWRLFGWDSSIGTVQIGVGGGAVAAELFQAGAIAALVSSQEFVGGVYAASTGRVYAPGTGETHTPGGSM